METVKVIYVDRGLMDRFYKVEHGSHIKCFCVIPGNQFATDELCKNQAIEYAKQVRGSIDYPKTETVIFEL